MLMMSSAESTASHAGSATSAAAGAMPAAAWAACCVLIGCCGLVEGFALTQQSHLAEIDRAAAAATARRDAAAAGLVVDTRSVSVRFAAMRAASAKTAAFGPFGFAGGAPALDEGTAVAQASAAEIERALGRLAMVHLALLASAICELSRRGG
mmetsp:Transcript_8748/g.22271  ORF Transcript_8748/g.22271 Transcript_8748/m.22271 type:complete len:153 (-) Transcript_8748:86-544(-)